MAILSLKNAGLPENLFLLDNSISYIYPQLQILRVSQLEGIKGDTVYLITVHQRNYAGGGIFLQRRICDIGLPL
jgi:hypothetical protein